MKQPTFQETETILRNVINGNMSREEASGWAYTYIKYDQTHELETADPQLWHLLTAISCCAELIAPDVYLYHAEDFRAWIEEYKKNHS